MAIFYPAYEEIQNLTVKPTKGEQALLDFLYANLSDDYEVIFQPSLNGANLDVAILRKDGGIVIIEVKDWHLESYIYKDANTWMVKAEGKTYPVLSPFKQVKKYKDELINFYMENSIEFIATNKWAYASIESCVFFYNADHSDIESFLSHYELPPYTYYLGRDDLDIRIFNSTFSSYFIKGKSSVSDRLYQDACIALKPSLDKSIPNAIKAYTKKQLDIIRRFDSTNRMRVKGAAGSGKSQVLSKIAVDRLQKTHTKVLILCFNITLRNYYIKLIRKSSPALNIKKSDIHIQNYHSFIKAQCANLNISIDDLNFYDKNNSPLFAKYINIFSSPKVKYDTILIDEVQDFKPNWIKNVLAFLNPNGKVLYCGDIKQDIYQHQDPSKINTNDIIYTEGCVGRWNELTETFRLPSEMVNFANAYAKEFLPQKNDVTMEVNKNIQGSLFSEGNITCEVIPCFSEEHIYRIVQEMRNADDYNNETQIGILGLQILEMRHLHDYFIKKSRGNRKITTTFESLDLFCALLSNLGFKNYAYEIMSQNNRDLERELDTPNPSLLGCKSEDFRRRINVVRRAKKMSFYMDNGSYKMSTIHSFKGWELDNIILIINPSPLNTNYEEDKNTYELIYTAITRAKKRLHILIVGNSELEAFYKKYQANRT